MKITIDNRYENKEILAFLKNELCLSRAQITRLKKLPDGILLFGEHATVRHILRAGDELSLALEDREDEENPFLFPIDLPISVIYEDEYIVAVNKAAGMPTHPTMYHHDDTLANALAFRYKNEGRPFVFRCANRLDLGTSGVVLVAKDGRCAAQLSRDISERRIDKEYIALVNGVTDSHGVIKSYIRREKESIIKRVNCDTGIPSEYAETEYTQIRENGIYSLLSVTPKTGRTHQIRVHMSGIGHSIVGDALYGVPSPEISHQALHCRSLTFLHPVTKEKLTLTAELPEDIVNFGI